MQTFLPYPDFRKSAECLDRQRLGKQRVEVMQILKALHDGGGWSSHPAVKMWRGHEQVLICYGHEICDEWISRGYKDTCKGKILQFRTEFASCTIFAPDWLHTQAFHASHRSNLLRKDPEHYGQFGWTESPDLEYVWPVTE